MQLNPTILPQAPEARAVRPVAASEPHLHSVQLYEDDAFLYEAVSDFLSAAMTLYRPALLIASREHREGFLAGLESRGVDVGRALALGTLTVLDAAEVGDAISAGGQVEPARFREIVGGAVKLAGAAGRGAVCAYGEIVDLFWGAGRPDEALRLEALWNELAETHAFTLLCGYSIRNFGAAGDTERFLEVCRAHHRVVPTERYSGSSAEDQLREVSLLQHRAQALEGEIARRAQLERELREALDVQETLLRREREARAEEANRAKRDFLAVMSHELRTPLNAIAGYAELLELGVHGPITETQRDSLERIQRSQRHLLSLIDEVLIYARSESGKLRYDIAPVPLGDVLHVAGVSVAAEMRAKGLEYQCAPCDPGVSVLADAEKARQVLMNLLGNAMKFTEPGGRVTLRSEVVGEEVWIQVRDTGIGIEPEKLEAVFDAFVQVDNRLARAHEGIGLGLAIARVLARGMNGELRVESTPGSGSTFTLALPRA